MHENGGGVSPWFPWPPHEGGRSTILYCFPHAGGSATQYRPWSLCARSRTAEICPVELPGRGARSGEPLPCDFAALVEGAAAAITACRDRSFALFGHSLGAYLAAALANRLAGAGRAPSHLFLSAAVRPDLLVRPDDPDALDEALLAELSGAPLPQEAMRGRWGDALPLLRADLALVGSANIDELALPVTVFSGTHDRIAPPERVEAWRSLCRSTFLHHRFDDGHLYLRRRRDEILDAIDSALANGKVERAAG